jgi:hypothetical protein
VENGLKSFVERWNIDYSLDRWWRKKYRMPFNSEKHRASCFIDMQFEFEEDKLFKELYSNLRDFDNRYIPCEKDFMSGKKKIFKESKEDGKSESDFIADNEFLEYDLDSDVFNM